MLTDWLLLYMKRLTHMADGTKLKTEGHFDYLLHVNCFLDWVAIIVGVWNVFWPVHSIRVKHFHIKECCAEEWFEETINFDIYFTVVIISGTSILQKRKTSISTLLQISGGKKVTDAFWVWGEYSHFWAMKSLLYIQNLFKIACWWKFTGCNI